MSRCDPDIGRLCVALLVAAALIGCVHSEVAETSGEPTSAESRPPDSRLQRIQEYKRLWRLASAYACEVEAAIDPPLTEERINPFYRRQESSAFRKVRDDLENGRIEPVCAVVVVDGWWDSKMWKKLGLEEAILDYVQRRPESLEDASIRRAIGCLLGSRMRENQIGAARALLTVDREEGIRGLFRCYGTVRPTGGEGLAELRGEVITNVAEDLRRLGFNVPDELTSLQPVLKLQSKEGNPACSPNHEVARLAASLFNDILEAHVEAGRWEILKRLRDGEQRYALLRTCLRSAEDMLLVGSEGKLESGPPIFVGPSE